MPDEAAGVADPADVADPAVGVAAAWVDAVVRLGGTRAAAQESAADLVRRYAEGHRSYHTVEHVAMVLAGIEWLAPAVGLRPRDSAAVTLAGCAHDVVYERQPGADEQASAEWARSSLTAAGLDAVMAQRVADLVLVTADHVPPPDDEGAAVLVDADLAILGSSPAAYEAYVRAVRLEYRDVAEADWRAGRAAVLERLLAEPLYRTGSGYWWWGTQARENVTFELVGLRRAPG